MKKFFSKIFKNNIASTVFVIILGLILTFFPSLVADTICYVLGGVCLLASLIYLIKSVTSPIKTAHAFSSLSYLSLGLILIIFKSNIFAALPLTAGICLFVFGLLKLYTASAFFRSSPALFKKLLVPAVINIILGIVLILIRHSADDIIIRIIGVILLYCAGEGIISNLLIRSDGTKKNTSFTDNKQLSAEFTESDEN
jgi:hypothetical protein